VTAEVLPYCEAQGSHVIPIPGTKTPKYLAANAGAADVTLGEAEPAELDAIGTPVGGRY
jgi:aryl-alcohol dehydrogenase-like predicted oxidoreductase